jgi:hypothetical protein
LPGRCDHSDRNASQRYKRHDPQRVQPVPAFLGFALRLLGLLLGFGLLPGLDLSLLRFRRRRCTIAAAEQHQDEHQGHRGPE